MVDENDRREPGGRTAADSDATGLVLWRVGRVGRFLVGVIRQGA
jgi:hypothetical protein